MFEYIPYDPFEPREISAFELKLIRYASNLTQPELGDRIKMGQSTVSKLENGKTPIHSFLWAIVIPCLIRDEQLRYPAEEEIEPLMQTIKERELCRNQNSLTPQP